MPIPDFVRDLRRSVGQVELWLPGVTAVVVRDRELLLVRRADNGEWSPVTGIVDPGEEPGVAARREVLEETGVEVSVDRLAWVQALPTITHVNGDVATYLDHTFACSWVAGRAARRRRRVAARCGGARSTTCRRSARRCGPGSPACWPDDPVTRFVS